MLQNAFGEVANDKTLADLINVLAFLADRLEYGMNTDNGKQLKVSLAGSGALGTVNTVGTVTTVTGATITNQQLIGGLAAQRTVEAQLDTAYNVGFYNNITF
mgnify:FL=1